MRSPRKLHGLTVEEKRWRALPERLAMHFMARMPGAESRFRRAVAEAVAADQSETLRYAVPFALAERVLGGAAIIDADPRAINRWLLSEAKSEKGIEAPRDHFFVDGRWDSLTHPLQVSDLDQEVREFIDCRGDYRQTRVFLALSGRLREEGAFSSNGVAFRKLDDIEAYCRHHLRLIDSIREHGVVRRSRLAGIGRPAERSTSNAAFLELVETDAGVAVGPGGKLLRYRGGFHRTAAARELGLASMPAQVKLVHLRWLRKIIRETGLPPYDALIEGLKRLSIPAVPSG